jgi:hypothetical protein
MLKIVLLLAICAICWTSRGGQAWPMPDFDEVPKVGQCTGQNDCYVFCSPTYYDIVWCQADITGGLGKCVCVNTKTIPEPTSW